MKLGLKVDIDTFVGARDGVPRLLEIFADRGLHATFFVSVGPDNSGKAVRRVFTRRGFTKKMGKSNALKLYGLRTMLSGTLLPAPVLAHRLADTFRAIAAAGHEVGLHAYDHVHWHDHLPRMSLEEVAAQLELGIEGFRRVFGVPPSCTASPGWMCTGASLQAQDELACRYHSDTRGQTPFLPVRDGYHARTIQLPTTLPTLDELLGTGRGVDEAVDSLAAARLDPEYNVFTLHTEVEGRHCPGAFARLLRNWQTQGVDLVPLRSLADQVASRRLPVCRIEETELPGRAGFVAAQGKTLTAP